MVIAAKPESVIVATNVKKFSGRRANSSAVERSDAESTGKDGFGALDGLSSSVISARAVLVTLPRSADSMVVRTQGARFLIR